MKLKLIIILFSIPLFAISQKQWTLSECINYALENNITAKQLQLNNIYSENALFLDKMSLFPNLNADVSHSYRWGQSIDPFTNQFASERVRSNNFNLSSNISLFNGLKKHKQIEQSQLDIHKNKYDLKNLLDNISLQIATVYLQCLFYDELIKTNINQIEITKLQLERSQKLVDAGTKAKGDLLLIESQLFTEEKYLVDAQNSYDINLLTLSQLMELNLKERFTIEKPQIELADVGFISMSAEEIYEIALHNRPSVMSAEYGVKIAEKGLSIAKTGYYPNISLAGALGTGFSSASIFGDEIINQTIPIGQTASGEQVFTEIERTISFETVPFFDQLNDNNNIYLGLNMSIPIFNGWQNKINISNARTTIESTRYELIQKKNDLRKKIQQAYLDANAALKAYSASQKKREAFQVSYKYSERKFEVGMINPLELNETKKELLKAESELLQSKYDYIFKINVLDFYMGKPIELKDKR